VPTGARSPPHSLPGRVASPWTVEPTLVVPSTASGLHFARVNRTWECSDFPSSFASTTDPIG